jgi:anti-sigma regulatory factor (Ser/Thr protein kinase)
MRTAPVPGRAERQAAPAPVAREEAMALPMTCRSVGLSRTYARRTLLAWGWAGDTEEAVLVVSELLTNAVHHGYLPGHLLHLRLALLENGHLLIDVADPLAAFPGFGTGRRPGADEVRGRGLHLVRQLCADLDWFPRPERGGKTVRAHLPGA